MEENQKSRFVVTEENWSLHRKGHQDQQRHLDKINEVLKSNLPDLISEENIILSNGKDMVKIPIRSLDEFKIRYNHDKSKHVGQGEGDSAVGDVVAQGGKRRRQPQVKEKKQAISRGKISMKRKSRLKSWKRCSLRN